MMNFDVISIGSATLDVFLESADLRVCCDKKQVCLPYGRKCEVEKLTIASGGGGTNTAVGFSRLGLKAAVLARCGQDWAGKIVFAELKKEKVDCSFLVQLKNEKTDYSTILIDSSGGATILVYRGGTRLEKSLINFQNLNSHWFYLASLEGNLGLLKRLIDFAKKNQIKVAVNPGRREISQKEKLLSVIKNVDVLIINQEERKKLGEITFGLVVVTRGREGLTLFKNKKKILESDGFKVKMADATGAGDGFGCGFVAGLIKGWPLPKALKLGISNGASVATKVGAKPGLLTEKQAEIWLKKPL